LFTPTFKNEKKVFMSNKEHDTKMSEILDNIIIDLKVIQRVPPKGRLCTTSHGHLKLEVEGNLAKIKRTINGDSRNRLVNRLKSLTSGITEISDNIISSLYFTRHYERERMNMFQINENSKKCHQLKKLSKELGECDPGLVNLKNTYGKDVRINAELDQIEDKFSEQIKKIEKALKLIAEEEKKLLGEALTSQPSPSALSNDTVINIPDDSDDSSENYGSNNQISTDPFE
jgi:hypothetical protein